MTVRFGGVLLVALVTLAGCGALGSGGGAAPSPTPMSDAEVLAIGKQIAQCFREQGIVEIPDPIVDEHHRLQLPGDAQTEIESRYPKSTLDEAQQACQSLFDQLPESAMRGGPEQGANPDEKYPGPEDIDALRAFAACARENGIPEWPDPKADGSFPVRGTALAEEGKSERMRHVFDACADKWSGGITFS
jgi:hypothetical protein